MFRYFVQWVYSSLNKARNQFRQWKIITHFLIFIRDGKMKVFQETDKHLVCF